MANIQPSACLKVNRDTFYIPDSNGGVYFRNNANSFRMEGGSIDQWIEKLLPIFNGKHCLGELTEGLPDPYRNRVYEIAEVLYQNGFARDVSQDRPHQLPEQVFGKYGSQIELLDSFGGSGAYRFQTYRHTKVLAVGSGSFFVSLASALLESGLPAFHMLITDSEPTNRQRLVELEAHARKTDPEAAIKEITLNLEGPGGWREAVRLYDVVLYVSQDGGIEQLRMLHAVCRDEKKIFLPAVCAEQAGMAGPLVHPDSDGCWESAWRRVHRSAVCKNPQLHSFSSTAGAMLANVIVFECFKAMTGMTGTEQHNRFFLLDLETLEGSWHPFMPHPLVTGQTVPECVYDIESRIERSADKNESNGLLSFFGGLTSAESGIFHVWEEGDLKQLPLSGCRIQAVDPLSEGPAELLPDLTCSELTHESARREAGLVGIEGYVSRLTGSRLTMFPTLGDAAELRHFVGIGAGETVAEAISRGLEKCLSEELNNRVKERIPTVNRVQLGRVEDDRCRYYMQALTTMQGEPAVALGGEVSGFPVVWIKMGDTWHGSIGLNTTMALRSVLLQSLHKAQYHAINHTLRMIEASSLRLEAKEPINLDIPACEEESQAEILLSALDVLKRNLKQLVVVDLATEPFLKEGLAGVYGVMLREGEAG